MVKICIRDTCMSLNTVKLRAQSPLQWDHELPHIQPTPTPTHTCIIRDAWMSLNTANLRTQPPLQWHHEFLLRCQAITWSNADLLSIGTLRNFSEIGIKKDAFENVVCEIAAILYREDELNKYSCKTAKNSTELDQIQHCYFITLQFAFVAHYVIRCCNWL